ncbi:Phosphoinositide phosphatase sac1 [Batrachochytrium dendrobatidis]|nr:Phosphoinositide phosphatase sac1 [Batrachochytrium dendrobatidis]
MSTKMIPSSGVLHRSSFKVLQTNDGRTLVENTLRLDMNGDEPSTMLVISDREVKVQEREDALPTSTNTITSTTDIMGVVGLLSLAYGQYLVGITSRSLAATIQSHKIWRIKTGIVIPVAGTIYPASPENLDDTVLAQYFADKKLLEHIRSILDSGQLYYSSTYDLTHSIQHNFIASTTTSSDTRIDDRYFFNLHMQSALISAATPKRDTHPWVLKIIAGFAGSIDIDYNPNLEGNSLLSENQKEITSKSYTLTLVSRLSHCRLGTRYMRRGIDEEGNAANSVEMEQIVFDHDFVKNKLISSFVQIRGSVPLLWTQKLDLSYRPALKIADTSSEESWTPVQKHYTDLKHQYIGERLLSSNADHGKVVCVNLLDDTGFEKPLTETFESTVQRFKDPKVTYESFPLNKWCKKMKYDNMDILLDRVRIRLLNNGSFSAEGEVPSLHSKGSLKLLQLQTGVARISCLDSLDRTNLTCSIFARYMIAFQVQNLSPGMLSCKSSPSTGVSSSDAYDTAADVRRTLSCNLSSLTNIWADSGDAISLLYAGTRALKADITRTGERQVIRGSINDGINSLTRYYLNNFSDGRKQDAYDIWSGKVTPVCIDELVAEEGVKQVRRLREPFIAKSKAISALLPRSVIDSTETFLFEVKEFLIQPATKTCTDTKKSKSKPVHMDEHGVSHTKVGFAIYLMRLYAPTRITNVVDFCIAGWISWHILILVKLFKIDGQNVVSNAHLTVDHAHFKK